jgi:ubiquinone/menaquinone biosynthesis C-methylase UbiE
VSVESANLDNAIRRKYRVRIGIFLVGVLAFVALLNTAYKGINTINVLNAIESERDQWQRSSEVMSSLNLKTGDVVADVGSGAGYFSLRLSRIIGRSGKVFAVDISRLPLVFLWIRAFSGGMHNIDLIVGHPDDPRLPVGTVNAVLIANWSGPHF